MRTEQVCDPMLGMVVKWFERSRQSYLFDGFSVALNHGAGEGRLVSVVLLSADLRSLSLEDLMRSLPL